MISASKLKSRPMCLQRSIASVPALAIQKRHFVDHLLVSRQVDGRSGVLCCAVRILLLLIVRLHHFYDNIKIAINHKKAILLILLVNTIQILMFFKK